MSQLSRSIIRGFGSTIGSMAARAAVKQLGSLSHESTETLQVATKKKYLSLTAFTATQNFLIIVSGLIFTVGVWLLAKHYLEFDINAERDITQKILIIAAAMFVCWIGCLPLLHFFKSKRAVIVAQRISELKKVEDELKAVYIIAIQKQLDYAKETHIQIDMSDVPALEGLTLDQLDAMMEQLNRNLNPIIEMRKMGVSEDNIAKIVSHEVWIGMSEKELQFSRGEATKIEVEEKKGKSIRKLIYGNKYSGDTFTFVNSELENFRDK